MRLVAVCPALHEFGCGKKRFGCGRGRPEGVGCRYNAREEERLGVGRESAVAGLQESIDELCKRGVRVAHHIRFRKARVFGHHINIDKGRVFEKSGFYVREMEDFGILYPDKEGRIHADRSVAEAHAFARERVGFWGEHHLNPVIQFFVSQLGNGRLISIYGNDEFFWERGIRKDARKGRSERCVVYGRGFYDPGDFAAFREGSERRFGRCKAINARRIRGDDRDPLAPFDKFVRL